MIIRSVLLIGALRGGVATHLNDLINGIAARNWTVYFFDLRQPFCSAPIVVPRNVTVIPINASLPARGSTIEDFARAMHEAINALVVEKGIHLLATLGTPPALIHCHDYHGFDAALHLSHLLGVPLATTVHLLHEPMMRWAGESAFRHCIEAERSMCERSDAVIAVSTSLLHLIHAVHPRARGRSLAIHNGVDINPAHTQNRSDDPAGLRSELGLEQKRVILYAGRFTPQKNLTALLHSAIRVAAAFPDVVYVLAGDDRNHPFVREMRSIVQEHAALRSSVRFIGSQSAARVAALYGIATLVTIPSYYEGLPYFALEAMATAVPVVAAATTGLSDLIEHRISGLLVPVTGHVIDNEEARNAQRSVDVGELASAQMELLADTSFATALGIAGLQRIARAFTKDEMIGATAALYETLIHRDRVKQSAGPESR